MSDARATVTGILTDCTESYPAASARLVPLVYEELRGLARNLLRMERPDHILQPTALVHEAYLRIVVQDRVDWKGKTHFMAVAATQMRRILVDHARKEAASKRGGRAPRITLRDDVAAAPESSTDLLALDQALSRLGEQHPRQATVAELRLFSGLLVKETAFHLGVSERTVKGDWRFARAWLVKELQVA